MATLSQTRGLQAHPCMECTELLCDRCRKVDNWIKLRILNERISQTYRTLGETDRLIRGIVNGKR